LAAEAKAAIDVAGFAEDRRRLALEHLSRARGVAGGRVAGPLTVVPLDIELLAGFLGDPPVLGDDRDAVDQQLGIVAAPSSR
jgi:hypothetical protein